MLLAALTTLGHHDLISSPYGRSEPNFLSQVRAVLRPDGEHVAAAGDCRGDCWQLVRLKFNKRFSRGSLRRVSGSMRQETTQVLIVGGGRQVVARLAGGNDVATLLRILPEDPWQGLVRFETTGETQWINAAQRWRAAGRLSSCSDNGARDRSPRRSIRLNESAPAGTYLFGVGFVSLCWLAWWGISPAKEISVSMNDDRSPLLDLMNCIVCNQTMKLEKSDPDDLGNDVIQYRCKLCGRIERLRLFRRRRV
jgi:hypothetical protein